MILDLETTFSDDQAPGTQGTKVSTNVYDLTASPLPIGPGNPVKVNIKVTETFVGANATCNIQLVSADAAAMDGNVEVVKETGAIDAPGTLLVGWQITLTAPLEDFAYRYMGTRYIIATADTTAGKFYAGIVCDEQTADSDWTAVTGF